MLKRLYIKIILFCTVLTGFFVGLGVLSCLDGLNRIIAKVTDSSEYLYSGTEEITPYIESVREKNGYTKLILGDSVCHQMYNDLQQFNEEICIVGSNGAVTMTGQYILLHEFLENHNNVSDVWLILIPGSLERSYDRYYGYQYAVLPFAKENTIELLLPATKDKIKDAYGSFALYPMFTKIMNRSALARKLFFSYTYNNCTAYDTDCVASISEQYICMMNSLCEKKGARLHLLPGPVADTEDTRKYMEIFTNVYNESELGRLFPEYCEQVCYYPSEFFKDGVHLGKPYDNQQAINTLIREMYPDSEFLHSLWFED